MRLNHLNLAIPDVPRTRQFFEKYFGFRCLGEPDPESISVLVDETGFVLTLSNFGKVSEVAYPGGFHVGFNQPSRDQVDAMHERLKADGFEVGPAKMFHGAWTFYFQAPGGVVVEVFHQPLPAPVSP